MSFRTASIADRATQLALAADCHDLPATGEVLAESPVNPFRFWIIAADRRLAREGLEERIRRALQRVVR